MKTLRLSRFTFHVLLLFVVAQVSAQVALNPDLIGVVEIPDPNLEKTIRENLELSNNVPITQQEMLQLTWLSAAEWGLTDLTGLESATNLEYLDLGGNQITDIRPLAGLIQLTWLSLRHNQVQDITPLTNVTLLTYLDLSYNYTIESLEPLGGMIRLRILDLINNRVKDLTPLANMTELRDLRLRYNQVGDLTPLANLVHLRILDIRDNLANDFTALQGLNLSEFYYDQACDIPPLLPPVRERIESRNFPSVFQAWDHVVGQDHLTIDQRYALHDLFWNLSSAFGIGWDTTSTAPTYGIATSFLVNLEYAREYRQRWLDFNPSMVLLGGVSIHAHESSEAFPSGSDFWLRDNQGQIVQNDFGGPLIDFLKPDVQDLLVKRIIAVARCGLYDGIFIDGFLGNGTGFVGRQFYSATDEEIMTATENILRAVCSQVRDDFLILVNANDTKPKRYTEFINGTFLETGKDHPGGYTRVRLQQLESVLSWVAENEKNLRSPQITCLEGQGMTIEPPDGPNNRRWMRLFTTMSLTHSDGYVLYTTGFLGGPDHDHLWYPFWDANLGRPIGAKAQRYQNIDGLFIREFTNGWAVYNRSGQAQTVTLPASATPVSDRGGGSASQTHLLPDLDGEIYLKVGVPIDLNADGTINVLDLILVSRHFGTTAGDVNADGTTNILDLTLVANSFSE